MRNKKGFTLFELLITMAIIGILAAVIGGSFGDAQKKGRDARRISDMDGLQKAAEMFYSFDNSYPKTSGAWTTVSGARTVLEAFPIDPKGAGWTAYSCKDVSGGVLNGTNYCCCATMEGTNKGNSVAACVFGGAKTHYCVKNQQ